MAQVPTSYRWHLLWGHGTMQVAVLLLLRQLHVLLLRAQLYLFCVEAITTWGGVACWACCSVTLVIYDAS